MRKLPLSIAVLAACLSLAACGGRNAETEGMPQAGLGGQGAMEMLEGTVMLTGSEPVVMVTLRASQGGSVNLTGALRDELARLSGARIEVHGTTRSEGRRTMEVMEYRVTSVNGETPYVGVLVRRDGGIWIDGEQPVRLVDVTSDLRSQIGAKIWVVGPRTADGVRPQSYGVIREP
jgi:hypothetical protein